MVFLEQYHRRRLASACWGQLQLILITFVCVFSRLPACRLPFHLPYIRTNSIYQALRGVQFISAGDELANDEQNTSYCDTTFLQVMFHEFIVLCHLLHASAASCLVVLVSLSWIYCGSCDLLCRPVISPSASFLHTLIVRYLTVLYLGYCHVR